jgi:pimeloyl-ACP methyl ester carboxylesterase
MKKFLLGFLFFIFLFVSGFIIYLYASTPAFNKEQNAVIQEVILHGPPEILIGDTSYAPSNGLQIWYESIKPENPKATILMIMGIGGDALVWPEEFLQVFADAGYHVIRYDNRDTGMSSRVENWSSNDPYSLLDMGRDGMAILDHLGIEQAHLVGISMGGMIAQELSINHPERVLTLTSIMSSGYIYDPDLPSIYFSTIWEVIKAGFKYGPFPNEKNSIKLALEARRILQGEADPVFNFRNLSEKALFNLRVRHGFNPQAIQHHNRAMQISGSRYEELRKLQMPVLVMHGTHDPLIPIEHSHKYSQYIPNSKTLWLEGMGHAITETCIPRLSSEILEFMESR